MPLVLLAIVEEPSKNRGIPRYAMRIASLVLLLVPLLLSLGLFVELRPVGSLPFLELAIKPVLSLEDMTFVGQICTLRPRKT